MNYRYHFFESIPRKEVIAAFQNWDSTFANSAYDNWLELFYKRASFLYNSQYQGHRRLRQDEFCKRHNLRDFEDVLEYDYRDAWEEYEIESGLLEHYDHYERYSQRINNFFEEIRDERPLFITQTQMFERYKARLESTEPWPDDHHIEMSIMALWFNNTFKNPSLNQSELRSMPYPEYLQTDHWRRIRSAIILAYGARCQHETCQMIGDSYWFDEQYIHVHHLTYKNRGHERFEDLQLLCDEHHKEAHK